MSTRLRGGKGGPGVTVVQTTVPAYRTPFLELLAESLDVPLRVLAGRDYFDPTVSLALDDVRVNLVPNRFLLRRRLLWQRRVVLPAVAADVVIAELNPRILSTWIVLMLRRVLRRPIVLWGHAWPRRGEHASSDGVRHVMRRLANALIVYSQTEAAELGRRMSKKLVVAAPNALYPFAVRPTITDIAVPTPTDFVFVGRLVEAKKPRLLLEAFEQAIPELPADTRLVFVGDGPLRAELEDRSRSAPPGRVAFAGERSNPEDLEEIYARAVASVIPGYAGLSLTQSLWFGVPSVIADDEPHSPEIEAADEGVNCVFFASDSTTALRDALIAVAATRETWWRRRGSIAAQAAAGYSLEAMVDAFLRTIRSVAA